MAAKKKPSSAADFRKKEEEDKRIARETKRNPVDAKGASYFGETMKDKFKVPGPKMPAGTPSRPPRKPQPSLPLPNTKQPNTPKQPSPTPTTTVAPRGMLQSGKLVPGTSSSVAKKKKK